MSEYNVEASVTGTVWKVLVAVGDSVTEDQPIAIIEAMKMEIPVIATDAGTVLKLHVAEGNSVAEGAPVATISE